LGINACADYAEAAQQLQQRHFAFIPLESMSGELKRIIDLKATLGLRSPVHTVARMLNPAAAETSIMGIFHPGYDQIHQSAAHLLQDKNMAVFKGEGGESERNPDTACQVCLLLKGEKVEETWNACFSSRHVKDETMDVSRMALVWRGAVDEYAEAAIISTAAIALRAMGRATDMTAAEQLARDFWQQRNLAFFD
jgi:anthranilate phosphoribosyltransferase